MKRVGIFTTYYNNNNYGGVLQAYALRKYISNLGFEVKDVCYEDVYITNSKAENRTLYSKISRYVASHKLNIEAVLDAVKKQVYKKLYGKKVNAEINKRNENFQKFRLEQIEHTNEVYNKDNVSECVDKFDIFVCGSDLVWNIAETTNLQPGYWLTFVHDKPKISYAASIPMNSVTDEQKQLIKSALSDFHAISVRENVGKNLLDLFIDTNVVKHVIDPVFLLTEEEWDNVSEKYEIGEDKYLLTYFLGDSLEYRNLAKAIAKDRKLKILNFAHNTGIEKNDIHFGTSITDASPEQFVYLFKNADMIITDSFHGVAFSMIFNKEFYAVERFREAGASDLNARLNSLLECMNAKKYLLKGLYKEMFAGYKEISEDSKFSNAICTDMINESKEFLVSALSSCK